VTLDAERDIATFHVSDDQQSYERGSTYLVLANDEDAPRSNPVEVQLGFEDGQRLLWITVHPASEALPAALLDAAARVS
jgi:hypothetical protein